VAQIGDDVDRRIDAALPQRRREPERHIMSKLHVLTVIAFLTMSTLTRTYAQGDEQIDRTVLSEFEQGLRLSAKLDGADEDVAVGDDLSPSALFGSCFPDGHTFQPPHG
jgi:hypothetical protein